VTFGFWQSLNSSWSAFQDFDIAASDNWMVKTGIKYETKNLQRAYDLPYGPFLPPDQVDAASYPYPTPPVATGQIQNRDHWIDQGVYVQTRYRLSQLLQSQSEHFLNFGLRYDDNSFYGSAYTMRAGYVGHVGLFGLKLLYGEAIQEPTPRQLYGGWTGSGSSPDLQPEESRTVEAYLDYTRDSINLAVNPYWVQIDNSIMNLTAGPVNLGERDIFGFDIHARHLLHLSRGMHVKLWGFYSFADTRERKFDDNSEPAGEGDIGDIADHKIYLGATGTWENDLSATLRGRFVGARKTVDTNPIPKVGSYVTADLNIHHRSLLHEGVGVALKVTNLFAAEYFHPGIRDANAGESPGIWDEDGLWQGSTGWSNSLLPQPGRQVVLSLVLSY
jgi:outer membrane receptor for ferrienterochelin and colicins